MLRKPTSAFLQLFFGTVITGLLISSISCSGGNEKGSNESQAFYPNIREAGVKADTGYNLTGTVQIAGGIPKLSPIKVSRMKKHCNPGTRPNNALIVSEAGDIANAVVYLAMNERSPSVSKKFSPPALDQKLCTFVPHVQVAEVGSKLLIKNSDPTMHSVHAYIYDFDTYFPQVRERQMPVSKTVFNLSMPFKNLSRSETLSQTGLLKLVCDVGHSWMQAYIWVVGHPFYAVTDSSGQFVIPEVPSGQWRIRVWHEYLGVVEKVIDLEEDFDIKIVFDQPLTRK